MNTSTYTKLNELLHEYSQVSAAIKAAVAEIETVQLAASEDLLPRHAEARARLTDIEAKLREISLANYEALFPEDKKRTHKTPFGTLRFHRSTSLEVDDEEKAILKIKLACERETTHYRASGQPPRFTADQLIRTHEELNLDALAALDDTTLLSFGLRREQKDNFKVLPFEMESDGPKKPAKREAVLSK